MHVVRQVEHGKVDFFYDSWYRGYVCQWCVGALQQLQNTAPPTCCRLLQAWLHYIPVTPSSLGSAVQDCLADDAACKSIGQNGNKLARCELALPTQKLYLQRVLQMIDQVQHPDESAQA